MPEFAAINGITGHQSAFDEKDCLFLVMDRRDDRSRMSRPVAARFPQHLAIVGAKRQIALITAAAGNQHSITDDERRGGVRPRDLSASKFLDEVSLPQNPTGVAFERVKIKFAAKDKDPVLGKHRGGAGAIPSVVPFSSSFAAAPVARLA